MQELLFSLPTPSCKSRLLEKASCATFALGMAPLAMLHAQAAPSATRDTARLRVMDMMKVVGRIDGLIGTASTASEGRVGAADLALRPITREGELLETVPGLIVTGDSVSRVNPLVRSKGGELGLRITPVGGLRSTASAWFLNLDSELLFTGDAGMTEPSAASRRRGVTFANFYRPIPQLSFDTDVSFAHAQFVGVKPGQDHVPGALENVVAAGVTFAPHAAGMFSAVRLRHFGSYALVEGNSSRARESNLVNADAGFQFLSGTRLQVSILNLLDGRADDVQYSYASRLKGESSDGVEDVHFHPAEPRQVRLAVGYRF